jgi:hypothetical protein
MEVTAVSNKFKFTRLLLDELPFTVGSNERKEYRDTELHGLVLRVSNRSKTYYVYHRSPRVEGATREIKTRLGSQTALSLWAARRLAMKYLDLDSSPCRGVHRVDPNVRSSPKAEIFPDEELLTTEQAMAIMKVSMSWLERGRRSGDGPPFLRRGRSVRYLRSDLLAWWNEGRCSG